MGVRAKKGWGLSVKHLLKHLDGFEFREIGHVETIVFVEHLKDAPALGTRKAEEAHGGIVHAKERGQTKCLLTKEVMSMQRTLITVGGRLEVKVRSGGIKVGIDAEEAAEMHEESEVKVGHRGW